MVYDYAAWQYIRHIGTVIIPWGSKKISRWGGAVEQLEVFSLGHRIFKSAAFWHSRWKFQKALEAA